MKVGDIIKCFINDQDDYKIGIILTTEEAQKYCVNRAPSHEWYSDTILISALVDQQVVWFASHEEKFEVINESG